MLTPLRNVYILLLFSFGLCAVANSAPKDIPPKRNPGAREPIRKTSSNRDRLRRPNVLFIAVDDLRPSLGCYGDPIAKSPHIDRLAKSGLVFNRAYCQQAVCSPSRTSLLCGRRPDTTRVFDLRTHFRKALPDVVTLPQLFKQQGYHTQSVGKIFHGIASYAIGNQLDDPPSWSVPGWLPQLHFYHTRRGMQIAEKWFRPRRKGLKKRYPGVTSWKDVIVRGLPWEAPDVPDSEIVDGRIATRAIEILREQKDKPFFLAVGFLKPHVPFVAPKKYFDLYPLEDIQTVNNPFFPKGAPKFAGLNSNEMRVYYGIPKRGRIADEEQARKLYRAYYACVSYVDAQVGRLLAELKRLNLREDTVVILWGDHGYHLGENGFWCKQTNFELSVRAPLIISVPGQKNIGTKTDALVEFVDIYPSLAELCGLPLPQGLEGTSFKPLLENPQHPWKTAAFSQYPRNIRGVGHVMGRSMRTSRYRFTEWVKPAKKFRVLELYDHKLDPEENRNIASQPENKELIAQLTKKLHAGWTAALPSKAHPALHQPETHSRREESSPRGTLIPVGVAKVDITPIEPIRLVGYGGRRTEAKSVASKIWAKALAIGSDEQKPCVLITTELIGVPAVLVDPLAKRLKKKVGLERARLSVCATHTHTGPAISGMLLETHFGSKVPQAQKDRIKRYTARLLDRLEQVALEALKNRAPSKLAWSEGKVGFAVNRRQIRNGVWVGMRPNRNGPVDHAMPILTVTNAKGKLRALFLNYACHCTTYGPKFNKIHGDWAGAAAKMIEEKHPGCVAMVALGCAGDANPQPRGASRGFQMVNRHGATVANEVERLLANQPASLKTMPKCRIMRIDLPLDHVPDRTELKKRLRRGKRSAFYAQILLDRLDRGEKIPASFSYPVQVWSFGKDLSMVFLAGEVAAGYSLRLKKESGDKHLWVNAYANDAPCYIATRKMIREGGYEVDESMNSYDKPTRLSMKVEDLIINAVNSLLK